MKLRGEWLEALLACVDEGTFDGASAALRVSPSAISQRIKALEQAVGQVVLVRTSPVRVTAVGEVLLRGARQRALVDAELQRALGSAAPGRTLPGAVVDLPVAVNADSLATWFVEVLTTVAEWGDARLRVFVEDQDHSARLLREGAVLGAVTASSAAVQGCSVSELGVMRYVPLVRRDLWERCSGRLAELPTLLELPVDRPRPTAASYRGAALPFRIAPEVATAVRAIAPVAGIPPNTPDATEASP